MTGVTVAARASSAPAREGSSQGGDAAPAVGELRLALLGGFELRRRGALVELPASVQRLVAFLAIRARPLRRLHVAGSLWLDVPEERANAALRTALWRSRRRDCPLVEVHGQRIALAPGVAVDLHDAAHAFHAALAVSPEDLAREPSAGGGVTGFHGELLPDWYEEWVLIERERHRLLRLHALEAQCAALTAAGRYGAAAEASIAAIATEPLRESAHRALIAVHLAEENVADALRQYRLFRDLLREQLGLEPSARLRALIDAAVTSR